MHVYRATQSIHPCCRAVSVTVCPSVCHVGVSKLPNLVSNFFIAWWPHHSSFPKGDPTVKFRRGAPSTGAPNRGGVPKICDFRPVFQKYRYRYRIPILTPNTDTDPALICTYRQHKIYSWWLFLTHCRLSNIDLNYRTERANISIHDIIIITFRNSRWRPFDVRHV